MHLEIEAALQFISSHLYSKLPRRKVNMLSDELKRQLYRKYQNHWHLDKPSKGSAYRSIKFNSPKVDQVVNDAVIQVGLDVKEVLKYLPPNMIIWIDPGEVSYHIEGVYAPVRILYKQDHTSKPTTKIHYTSEDDSGCGSSSTPVLNITNELHHLGLKSSSSEQSMFMTPSPSFNCAFSMVDNNVKKCDLTSPSTSQLTSPNKQQDSMDNMSLRSSPRFTAASFAQTKFGSTKLKTNSKRHMLPEDLCEYTRQRSFTTYSASENNQLNNGLSRNDDSSYRPSFQDISVHNNNSNSQSFDNYIHRDRMNAIYRGHVMNQAQRPLENADIVRSNGSRTMSVLSSYGSFNNNSRYHNNILTNSISPMLSRIPNYYRPRFWPPPPLATNSNSDNIMPINQSHQMNENNMILPACFFGQDRNFCQNYQSYNLPTARSLFFFENDPNLNNGNNSELLLYQQHPQTNTLVGPSAFNSPHPQYIPQPAAQQMSADRTSYTYQIQPNAHFNNSNSNCLIHPSAGPFDNNNNFNNYLLPINSNMSVVGQQQQQPNAPMTRNAYEYNVLSNGHHISMPNHYYFCYHQHHQSQQQ